MTRLLTAILLAGCLVAPAHAAFTPRGAIANVMVNGQAPHAANSFVGIITIPTRIAEHLVIGFLVSIQVLNSKWSMNRPLLTQRV
jgi:hypothetical protein